MRLSVNYLLILVAVRNVQPATGIEVQEEGERLGLVVSDRHLYNQLASLEENGMVRGPWKKSGGRWKERDYRITEAGLALLAKTLEQLQVAYYGEVPESLPAPPAIVDPTSLSNSSLASSK